MQLGIPPNDLAIASKNTALMRKNAEKFYRGAAANARVCGGEGEVLVGEARVREEVCKVLGGDGVGLEGLVKEGMAREVVRGVVAGMLEEGLVAYEEVGKLGFGV